MGNIKQAVEKDFISRVQEITETYIFELTRNDKMTKENALESD